MQMNKIMEQEERIESLAQDEQVTISVLREYRV